MNKTSKKIYKCILGGNMKNSKPIIKCFNCGNLKIGDENETSEDLFKFAEREFGWIKDIHNNIWCDNCRDEININLIETNR